MKKLRLANIIPVSDANGPGPHFTIWVQGCSLRCPGCFNPHTHDPNGGYSRTIPSLIHEIKKYWEQKQIRGVSITGGEPLQQIDSLTNLLQEIKAIGNIGTIVLSGYNKSELQSIPGFDRLKQYTDVLISGRFLYEKKLQKEIRGSTNKEILFYSSFYHHEEFETIPPLEVFTDSDGSICITGIKPEILEGVLKAQR
ncbi:MAG: 4Fe-4S single cluster domain-containing protein [Promethearchaeota archaeon]